MPRFCVINTGNRAAAQAPSALARRLSEINPPRWSASAEAHPLCPTTGDAGTQPRVYAGIGSSAGARQSRYWHRAAHAMAPGLRRNHIHTVPRFRASAQASSGCDPAGGCRQRRFAAGVWLSCCGQAVVQAGTLCCLPLPRICAGLHRPCRDGCRAQVQLADVDGSSPCHAAAWLVLLVAARVGPRHARAPPAADLLGQPRP